MQQCPKCSYEFTMREIQEKTPCPKCAQWAAIDARAEEIVQERRTQTAGRSATVNKAMEGMAGAQPVVVVDFRMDFLSLVKLFFKAGLAAIPALIMVKVVLFVFSALIGIPSGLLG
ncbi:hypothetical protein [Metapseudomonas otitidis]|uniref:hypothetical protein n=1 Tax=Metapseudomonas otitidis TaxID=319939 RepID=UPI00366CBC93